MTTPDHRPYLVEGDLRTPEDVRDWILAWRDRAIADCKADQATASLNMRLDYACSVIANDIACDLSEELDRERRQACRRGALEAWRTISRFLSRYELPMLGVGDPIPQAFRPFIILQFGSHSPDGHPWRTAGDVYAWLYGAFERALAFRAAARAK